MSSSAVSDTHSHLVSYHSLSVLESLEKLYQALEKLRHPLLILDAALPLWFQPPHSLSFPSGSSDREKVFLFLSQLQYLNEQDPKEILIGPGIVAASQATLDAIHELNLRKQAFKQQMLALKAMPLSKTEKSHFVEALEQLLNKRPGMTAKQLKRLGLARLHLKQCYRQIPFFLEKPESIAWTWANTRSISRISVMEAELRLQKQGLNERTAWQQQKLTQLAKDEPLAIVQELAPHLRANVCFRDDNKRLYRKMVKGPVPFFYLAECLSSVTGPTAETLPRLRPAGDKKAKDKNRPTRKDVKLEPLPFIPAIRAHRYRIPETA